MKVKSNDAIQRIRRLVQQHEGLPFFFMLIGAPGCGKSTFAKFLVGEAHASGASVLTASTDDQIDQEAIRRKMTYSQAFKLVNFKQLKRQMSEQVEAAIKNSSWIIWDQMNGIKGSRRKKLATIPESYIKVAVILDIDERVLIGRLMARAQATGKVIPQFVVDSFNRGYETPTKDEGFHYLFEVDNN